MNRKVSVLIMDPNGESREAILEALRRSGYRGIPAESPVQAMDVMRRERVDILLVELADRRADGLAVISRAKEFQPEAFSIAITDYDSIDRALRAVQEGAYDYLIKPLSLDKIDRAIEKALEARDLILENRRLQAQLRERFSFKNIVGKSPPFLRVLNVIAQVAPTRSTVLISGESGTGKELVAQAIHYNSPRASGPFVKLSCAALPESLLESELFGHERGAFTGAVRRKDGLFKAADGGTLFLDEIGELSSGLQAKLLRAIEEGEIRPVGSITPQQVDVRIIAATNRDLARAVREGSFREDLYYRLNVISIHLPPLRERKDDIPLLAYHFLMKHSSELGKELHAISPEAMRYLESYNWPGNVRELENAIEHAVVMATSDPIRAGDLPESVRSGGTPDTGDLPLLPLRELERRAIHAALRRTEGDKREAAKLLGIGVATLYRKIKKYNL